MTEAEWQVAGSEGYLQRTDRQFHWENRGYSSFDDFLADLASAKRKNLRKERANVALEGISFEWLSGGDLLEGAGEYVVTLRPDVATGRVWPRARLQVWTRPPVPAARAWANVAIAGQSELIVDYGVVPSAPPARGSD